MNIKEIVFKKPNYIHIVSIAYCLCIIAASFQKWTNYANIILLLSVCVYIFCTGTIKNSFLCIGWSVYIFLYPILDCAIRNENGLPLFTLLSYLAVIGILLFGGMRFDNIRIIVAFIKIFACFQCFGVFLSKVLYPLYVPIAWRLVGFWNAKVSGFTSDPTLTTNILVMGIGAFAVDLWIHIGRRKNIIIEWICLFFLSLAMLIEGKRSFLIAMVIAFSIIFLADSKKNNKKFWRVLFSIIILLIGGIALSLVFYKFGNESNGLSRIGATILGVINGDDVTSMRTTWAEYMKQWRVGHELRGIGWERFQVKLLETPYGGKVPNGHCVYKQILCETGYIGITFLILLLVITVSLSIRNILFYSKERNKVLLGFSMLTTYIIIVFSVYCYFGNAIYDASIYMYFFVAVSIVGTLYNYSKKIKKRKVCEQINE